VALQRVRGGVGPHRDARGHEVAVPAAQARALQCRTSSPIGPTRATADRLTSSAPGARRAGASARARRRSSDLLLEDLGPGLRRGCRAPAASTTLLARSSGCGRPAGRWRATASNRPARRAAAGRPSSTSHSQVSSISSRSATAGEPSGARALACSAHDDHRPSPRRSSASAATTRCGRCAWPPCVLRRTYRLPRPVVPVREELPFLLNARGLVGTGRRSASRPAGSPRCCSTAGAGGG
jgi:hypothetical protein